MININKNDLKIPLVIGVTGHRDIPTDNISHIESKVIEIFDSLIEKYPNTPLILLSPLADGADRIVAKIILEDKEKEKSKYKDKIFVSVPLPMDIDAYKETFGKGSVHLTPKESSAEFEKLLAKVNDQIDTYIPKTIPMVFDRTRYNELVKHKDTESENEKKERRKPYVIVGEYIAIHSHILIALQNPAWKGEEGGTAEVVNKKLNGNYTYVTSTRERVTLPERGLVYRILTPRIKDTDDKIIKKDDRFKLEKLFPSDDKNVEYKKRDWDKKEVKFITKIINIFVAIWSLFTDFLTHLFTKPYITKSEAKLPEMTSFRREHKHINYLNEIINNNYKKIKIKACVDLVKAGYYLPSTKYTTKSREKNLDQISAEEVSQINIQNLKDEAKLRIRQIIIRRSFAFLSSHYQTKMEKFEKVLLMLILISSFTFFILSKIEYIDKAIINSIYILVIFSFYIFSVVFKKYKNLHEDTRALSEGMRVHIAWKDANIDESVAFSYPSTYKDELNWIRTSLRSLNIFYFPQNKNIISKDKIALIETTWIDEQIKYFKRYKKYQNIEDTYNTNIHYSATIFLISGFLLALNIIVPFLSTTEVVQLKVFSGVFLTLASFTKAKQLFDGYTKIIKEYKLSLAHFERAKELLKDERNDKQKIYKSLGIEALQENTFWTILRREKNYKSPSL